MGREWELNLRHHVNGNELMGMGENGNVASHSHASLHHQQQLNGCLAALGSLLRLSEIG